MKRIDVADLHVALDISGDGPALVLVHGFPLNRSMWARQRRCLTGFRVVAPDLRGFGKTSPVAPFSMPGYAADLTGLLDRLGIPDAVFGGLSMGGYVLFELFRQAPDRIRGMILMSTRATADDQAGTSNRDALIEAMRARGRDVLAESLIPKLLASLTRHERPAVELEVRKMIESNPLAGMIGAVEAMRDRIDSTDLLAHIAVPCLVLAGEHDPITPPHSMREMASRLPDARFVVIPGAAHLSPIERPREVNRAMAEFLGGF